MVVLAAAVCTKSGKTLVSRQFVDISRVRIEGLLAAFPKLMGPEKQHTFIETDSVRYVYHPLETLYMLLITSKASNILEDLDTLNLLSKLIPEICQNAEEDEVVAKAFELTFAFDEVISLGYKEKTTIQQIKTFTEMDSHEERVHEMLERNKQREALELAKKKQQQIEKTRQDYMKTTGGPPGKFSGMGGGTGFSGMGSSVVSSGSDPIVIKPPTPAERSYNSGSGGSASASSSLKKGMVLGSKAGGKTNDYLMRLMAEGAIEKDTTTTPTSGQAVSPGAPATKKEPVHLKLEEKLVVVIERDGALKSMEVKGDLIILISDANFGRLKVKLKNEQNKSSHFKKKLYQTHPNIDKNIFNNNNVLCLRDGVRSFPTGSPLGVLRWRFQTKEDSAIPLSVSCWPSLGSENSTIVNLDCTLNDTNFELRDVVISIPLPPGTNPVVNSADGSYQFDGKNQTLNWVHPLFDSSSPNASMEFAINFTGNNNVFFPLSVSFRSLNTYAGLKIEGAATDEGPVSFSSEVFLATEQYEIV